MNMTDLLATLAEVSTEISNINRAAGETVFNPAATGSLRAAMAALEDGAVLDRSDALAVATALDTAAATVELYTPQGAQTQPEWPRTASGDIDPAAVAALARVALARTRAAMR